jgi:hypothetical protein
VPQYILSLQVRIIGKHFVSRFAGSDQSHKHPHRHPHPTDAKFTAHDLGIEGYASQIMHLRLLYGNQCLLYTIKAFLGETYPKNTV